MRINELKKILAATLTSTAPQQPINQYFVPLGELLMRVQRTPDMTMQQAAYCLLNWYLFMDGAPEIKVNSKVHGIIPADKKNEKWAIARLDFIIHRGHFDSDGDGGSSIDYELFGFDRKEFDDFLRNKVGEPLDLFCPVPEPTQALAQAAPASRPVTLASDKAKVAKNWGEHELQQLLSESREPGMTQQKLAEKYGVKRQRIGALLQRAAPKKAGPFDALNSRKGKK